MQHPPNDKQTSSRALELQVACEKQAHQTEWRAQILQQDQGHVLQSQRDWINVTCFCIRET